jgi:hypothetical protein
MATLTIFAQYRVKHPTMDAELVSNLLTRIAEIGQHELSHAQLLIAQLS